MTMTVIFNTSIMQPQHFAVLKATGLWHKTTGNTDMTQRLLRYILLRELFTPGFTSALVVVCGMKYL